MTILGGQRYMNITFLIGNGFDVGVGMRSKFKDFFPQYIDKSKTKEKDIQHLAIEIERECEKYVCNCRTWKSYEAV